MYKKVVCYSLVTLAIVAIHARVFTHNFDYKIKYLKHKSNCLSRKVNRVLGKMDEESLKKYKDELLKSYENIKNKIDNLTIKDIKQAGNDVIDTILDSIEGLKYKLLSYS